MNLNWKHHPTHGFRFSTTDALAIVVCAVATTFGLTMIGPVAWFVPFVLGHFFLFCNLFRVRRIPELIWAGGFLAVVVACLVANVSVLNAMWLVLPLTFGVLTYSIRRRDYHGIGSVAPAKQS